MQLKLSFKLNEERRPGITKLFEKIKGENPRWSENRCAIEAKHLYVSSMISVGVGPCKVQVENPDYLGGSAHCNCVQGSPFRWNKLDYVPQINWLQRDRDSSRFE